MKNRAVVFFRTRTHEVTRNRLTLLSALALPSVAYAQRIPTAIAAMAVSPLLVILLAVAHGVLSRSWRAGAAHTGLVLLWVLMFGVASYWVENDYVIWTPLVLYGVHAITLLILVVKGLLRRREA